MAARHWLFTYFKVDQPMVFPEWVTYAVYQREMAPTTNKEHYQGYLRLSRPQRPSALQKLWPGMHHERVRGTPQQCIDYCTKEDTRIEGPWHHGVFKSQQGRRTDLEDIKDCIKGGFTMKDVSRDYFSQWVRYHKAFDRYALMVSPKRNQPPEVYWYSGPAGSGKSRRAHEEAPDAYWKDLTKWWDNYNGIQSVIIDDFEPTDYFTYKTLLRLFDRYPMQVQTKGGYINFNPPKIIVTSTYPPDFYYPEYDQQLARRITRHACTQIEEHQLPQAPAVLQVPIPPKTVLSGQDSPKAEKGNQC